MNGGISILGPGVPMAQAKAAAESGGLLLVPSIEMQTELTKAGCGYVAPEQIASVASCEEICVSAYESLRQCLSRFDALVPEAHGVCTLALWEAGARQDGLLWRAAVLQRLRLSRPGAGISWLGGIHPEGAAGVFEFPWSDCSWQKVWRLSQDAEAAERGSRASRTPQDLIRAQLSASPILWSIVQGRKLGGGLLPLLGVLGREPCWLLLKAPYDWQEMLTDERVAGRRVLFDEPARYFPRATKVDPAVTARLPELQAAWEEHLSRIPDWARATLKPLHDRILAAVLSAPSTLRHIEARVAETLDAEQVKLVVNAIGSDLRSQVVLQTYRRFHAPVVKWQHGAVWQNQRITQRMDDSDLATSDVHFVYGPGTRRAYLHAGRHSPNAVVVAGSPRLARLRFRRRLAVALPDRPRRILYTATGLYGEEWYCGFSPPFSDSNYCRNQRELLDGLVNFVRKNLGASLTVKLPYAPAQSRVIDDLITFQRQGVPVEVVTRESTHTALLEHHDTVVLDCPTTTLLEAICSDAAIYLLHVTPAWPDADLALLCRRAVVTPDAASLLDSLARHQLDSAYGADRGDETFLRHHGTGGESAQASTFLHHWLGERRRAGAARFRASV